MMKSNILFLGLFAFACNISSAIVLEEKEYEEIAEGPFWYKKACTLEHAGTNIHPPVGFEQFAYVLQTFILDSERGNCPGCGMYKRCYVKLDNQAYKTLFAIAQESGDTLEMALNKLDNDVYNLGKIELKNGKQIADLQLAKILLKVCMDFQIDGELKDMKSVYDFLKSWQPIGMKNKQ